MLSTSPKKAEDAARLGAKDFASTKDPATFDRAEGALPPDPRHHLRAHDYGAYLRLLRPYGTMVVVGAPPEPDAAGARMLIRGNKRLAGSLIGGLRETQEMLDFCGEHRIVSDVEIIAASASTRPTRACCAGTCATASSSTRRASRSHSTSSASARCACAPSAGTRCTTLSRRWSGSTRGRASGRARARPDAPGGRGARQGARADGPMALAPRAARRRHRGWRGGGRRGGRGAAGRVRRLRRRARAPRTSEVARRSFGTCCACRWPRSASC